MTPDEKAKAPDAEIVEEEKHDVKPKVEVVTVLHADEAPAEDVAAPEENAAVRVRVETRSRHRLMIKCFEMDDDGVIDIIISDADVN